jgi:hypothetical protein
MKRTLLIAILVGASLLTYAQSQGSTDEITGLKKQVSSLKQTNAKLEQNVKELKKSSKDMQDNLDVRLKEYDQKMNVMGDSLKAKEATIVRMDNREAQLFHSLNLRKIVAYIIFAVVLVLLIVVYFLLMKKFKTIDEKNEVRIFNLKDALDVEANKTKSDIHSQIALVKTEIAFTKEDLEKKIKEVKK